ncbi:MAG: class I SAM-dependent methyltransferase, partial [Muribaculaceae bacterium]|nr:class I SAM-dependent methyltransferase [Muribaculaceae bacterium]
DKAEVRSTPARINAILDYLNIEKNMSVLDLGTGTGVLLPYLSERVGKNGKVVGVDMSGGMLSLAEQKYGQLANVELLKLDFEEEVIPGSYDLILLYSVYPHLHFPFHTLEWLLKMNLNQDGTIVIAFPSDEEFINNIHHERASDSDHLPKASVLAQTLSEHGFKAKVISATKDEYIVAIEA